jgi:hypothetical protein
MIRFKEAVLFLFGSTLFYLIYAKVARTDCRLILLTTLVMP